MPDFKKRTSTQTHIRTIYSDLSYITIKFFNNALSLNFVPAVGKDSNGFNQYQKSQNPTQGIGVTTTINYETAAALLGIINNKIMPAIINNQDISITIQLANQTELTIERKNDEIGHKRTFLNIKKDNNVIPYKFGQQKLTITENGNMRQEYNESGLAHFVSIIKGYLEGINAERHLNKLTDDYASLQQNSNNKQNNYQNRKQYNNNPNRQNYNNQSNDNDLPWETNNQPNTISISSYSIDQQ